MTEQLLQDFYGTMYKYQLAFLEKGVRANLEQWQKAKEPLVELLRHHPLWNERELAIVFDVSEQRELDEDSVDETKFELFLFAESLDMMPDDFADFKAAIDAATADHACVPDESRLEVIRQRGRIKCAPVQKASRIINKVCLKFGLDQYEEDKVIAGEARRVHPYNAIFARVADALNPVKIQKTAVLSVHPCDFLEMSNKDDNWHSCHCLADGGWKGGCQSYMGDGVSMIFFTVDEAVKSDFHKAPRLTREIFCYQDGLLLQSRLYPTDDNDQRALYRNMVQKAVAACLDAPNLWSVKREINEIKGRWQTTEHALHYKDYDGGYAVLSFLKGRETYGCLTIGSVSLCPCCGGEQLEHGQIKCGSCKPMVVCKACGETVSQYSAQYAHGAYYCKACYHVCAHCGDMILGAGHPAFDQLGRLHEVCGRCYQEIVSPCAGCGVHTVCAALRGGQFCPRTAVLPSAA